MKPHIDDDNCIHIRCPKCGTIITTQSLTADEAEAVQKEVKEIHKRRES